MPRHSSDSEGVRDGSRNAEHESELLNQKESKRDKRQGAQGETRSRVSKGDRQSAGHWIHQKPNSEQECLPWLGQAGAGWGREARAASPFCYLPSSPNLSGWAAYHLERIMAGHGASHTGRGQGKSESELTSKVSQVKDYPVLRIVFTHQDGRADSTWSLAPSAGLTEVMPVLRLIPIP